LSAADSRLLHVGGLVAEVGGQGPPLLLVHGLGSARTAWRPVVPALREHFTTITVDLPGHGDALDRVGVGASVLLPSQHADALTPLLEDFGGAVHVVGNSMGGWVGLELASRGQALSLTALCPAGLARHPWTQRNSLLNARKRLATVLGPVAPPLTRLIASTPGLRSIVFDGASADLPSLDVSLLTDAATAMAKSRSFDRSHDGMLGSVFERGSDIDADVPVTIVWGDVDPLIPFDDQNRDLVPGHARWIVFEACAHVPMWDQPQRTIDVITETALN